MSTNSNYKKAKAYKNNLFVLRKRLIDFFIVVTGVLSAAFALKSFLLPNGFLDGGAVGISLLFHKTTGINLSYLLILVNFPFLLFGFRILGKEFSLKTFVAISLLSIAVAYLPYPPITNDKLLIAIFGGFFLGLGIGLAVRGGCVIDGTEVLAIQLSKKLHTSIGDIILVINIIIFSVAAYLFSIETALYSLLTYFSASKTADFIIEGIEEYTGVTIISIKSEEIREMIISVMGRGVTIYKGEKGFIKNSHADNSMNIVFTVITRLEINKLYREIEKIDPQAFVIMNSIKDTKGGLIKKRPLKN